MGGRHFDVARAAFVSVAGVTHHVEGLLEEGGPGCGGRGGGREGGREGG